MENRHLWKNCFSVYKCFAVARTNKRETNLSHIGRGDDNTDNTAYGCMVLFWARKERENGW